MNKSNNHIPRNFTMICATCICETSAGKPSKWFIWRDYCGYHIKKLLCEREGLKPEETQIEFIDGTETHTTIKYRIA